MNDHSIRKPLALAAIAGATGVAMLVLDGGVLAAPRTWGVTGWTELVDERGPAAGAMTALRLVALAASAYLVILAAATSLVRTARVRRLDALLAFATPRVLRPLLGIVTVATFAAPHAAGATERTSTPPVMVLVDPSDATTTTTTPTPTSTSAGASPRSTPPTMRRVDAPASTVSITTSTSTTSTTTTPPITVTTPTTTLVVSAPPLVSTPAPKPPPTAPARPSTWTIDRGEHLWHVAETVVRGELGAAPTDEQVTAYWRVLVGVNRDRLVDPDNPDLVFTGQELLLPPV